MAGRPKYEFTDEQIVKAEELAFKGCQNRTIARILGCDDDTIKKYLSPQLDKKRAERKVWLREVQNIRAKEDKTGAVAIFLGKNELNQTDKQIQIHGVTDDLGALLAKIGKVDDLRPDSDKECSHSMMLFVDNHGKQEWRCRFCKKTDVEIHQDKE